MDEPSSGLPPDAFASPNQHLNPYTRFLPHSAHHTHPAQQRPPPPRPSLPQVRDGRQPGQPFATHLGAGVQSLDPNDTFATPFEALSSNIYNGDYSLQQQQHQQQQHQHPHQQHQHQHQQQEEQQQQQQQQLYTASPGSSTPLPHHNVSRSQELASHPTLARDGGQLKATPTQTDLLLAQTTLDDSPFLPNDQVQRLRQEHVQDVVSNESASASAAPKQGGHFPGMKMVPNPPNLELWRKVLFEVDKPIELTEEEFQTYFPHVDNIYSHRSTQRYKRQPFVSHYWDCRLKGRPPGTPKSDDPNKRKRKRQARERDLCDVKIKITEYFPNARSIIRNPPPGHGPNGEMPGAESMQAAGLVDQSRPFPGADGARYYQVQRVNGNGGNGKTDGIAGPHKHTLDDSDRIKKNSIQRAFAKDAKEKKKAEKTYHKKATGLALATVKKHSRDDPLKLFGSWSCPFTQRVWIALELKGVAYQYVEWDPDARVGGFVTSGGGGGGGNPQAGSSTPLLRHDGWDFLGSGVLLQYLDELYPAQHALLPADIRARAHARRWGDFVDRELVPSYYKLLAEQDPTLQAELLRMLDAALGELVAAATQSEGPFFGGRQFGFVDAMLAPWVVRMRKVLRTYRGWQDPDPSTGGGGGGGLGSGPDSSESPRLWEWIRAIEATHAVARTTSADELYRESVERFMEQRSVNPVSAIVEVFAEGRGLP